jgi:hypothetical protein
MRCTAGYSLLLDLRRNEDISKELTSDPAKKKLTQCKQKWLYLVSRMEDIRYPKHLLDYQPIGRRPGTTIEETTR